MPDLLTNNWPLKLLSVALAFSIWVALTSQTRLPRSLVVPLTSSINAEQLYRVPPPTEVAVRLEGPKARMVGLDPKSIFVSLDLRSFPVGDHEVVLTAAHVSGIPNRVDLMFFEPKRVHLTLDKRMQRRLAVEPNLVSSPPDGLHVYASRVTPETVVVEGPASVVETMSTINTNPVSLDDQSRPFTRAVSVDPERPGVRLIDRDPLELRVVIDEAPEERSFSEIPISVASEADRVALVPSVVRVILSGPPSLLDRLPSGQIRPRIDLSDIPSDGKSHRVPVRIEIVDLPQEQQLRVNVKAVRPTHVSVRLDAGDEEP